VQALSPIFRYGKTTKQIKDVLRSELNYAYEKTIIENKEKGKRKMQNTGHRRQDLYIDDFRLTIDYFSSFNSVN
jgi:hypothetical protein